MQKGFKMNKRRILVSFFIVIFTFLFNDAGAMGYKPDTKQMEMETVMSEISLIGAVNAQQFGAKADGKHDDTAAIQKALNYAKDHGPICFLPAGHYRIEGVLIIPGGVTLTGAGGSVSHAKTPNGTVLLIYGGKDDPDGDPAIVLNWSSVISKVTIHYPDQLPPPNVTPYPWTIQARGQLCQVLDVTITNPYKALDFGTYHNELHIIRNVFACPLNIGVYIDQCYDVGRMENVHFNPNFWKRSELEPKLPTGGNTTEASIDRFHNELLGPYLEENLIGFKIGKTDWEYVTNCFVILAKEGFTFDDYGHGPGNALVTQSGSDVGPIAVMVRKTQVHAGVQFVNCQLMATVKIGPENRGPVKITNSGFWEVPGTQEQIYKQGSGPLILNGCHFTNWDMDGQGKACVYADGGRVSISHCDFMADKTAIFFGKGLVAATVVGNLYQGETLLDNQSGIDVQCGLNSQY
jgi:hypothetical protein